VTENGSSLAYGYCSAGHWTAFPAAAVEQVRAIRPRCPACGTRHFSACPKCGRLITSDTTYHCVCDQHFPPRISLEHLALPAA
jgi:tRNA(Ile2) C34 agmatinyltransferase TiaS